MYANEIDRVYKEVEALRKLEHQNIVRLKSYFPSKNHKSIVLVMDYASGGELLRNTSTLIHRIFIEEGEIGRRGSENHIQAVDFSCGLLP